MNLFLLGWKLLQDIQDAVRKVFNGMIEVYPQLDSTTCRYEISEDGSVFAATMHHSDEAISPRRYVWKEDDEITFYDGVPFDSTGSFAAHDAAMLTRYWHDLPEKLDGHFVIARVKRKPPVIEVMTDILGHVQVNYCRRGDSWLISNSVRPLVRLCGAYEFDPVGVSMFLSQTWVWDGRTLRKDIRTIGAGQLWKFELDRSEPTKHTYCSAASLVPAHKKCLSTRQITELGEKLIQLCRFLNETLGPLWCALTGGRDTRVLMSLLETGGIQGRYFTSGHPKSKDVVIASQIARKYNLQHDIRTQAPKDIIHQWDVLCERLIHQGDGMISLWQLSDVLNQPQQVDRLTVSVSGLISANYYNPLEAMQKHRPEDIGRMMIDALVFDYGGLVLPEARRLSMAHIRKTIQELLDQGLPGLDALDIFNLYQRVGRWAGSSRRKSNPVVDTFAPFCLLPYTKAVFTIPYVHRYYRWLHQQLLRSLMPALTRLPYDRDRDWPHFPWLNMLHWILERSLNKGWRLVRRRFPRRLVSAKTDRQPPEFDQSAWLEVKRDWMREICLDQRDSMLWDFVNRPLFEQIMSDTTDPAERQAYRLGIYGIVTLFYYAATEKRRE